MWVKPWAAAKFGLGRGVQRTVRRSKCGAALRHTNISSVVLSSCNQNWKLFTEFTYHYQIWYLKKSWFWETRRSKYKTDRQTRPFGCEYVSNYWDRRLSNGLIWLRIVTIVGGCKLKILVTWNSRNFLTFWSRNFTFKF